MSSIFDQYSLLDPAKMLREIDAETEGETFDNYSLLDPNRVRAQLAAIGIEVSNAAMLDPALFEVEMDAVLSGSDENVLQLGGENLQLGGEDLTLGA